VTAACTKPPGRDGPARVRRDFPTEVRAIIMALATVTVGYDLRSILRYMAYGENPPPRVMNRLFISVR
jgi:hypothetical protein